MTRPLFQGLGNGKRPIVMRRLVCELLHGKDEGTEALTMSGVDAKKRLVMVRLVSKEDVDHKITTRSRADSRTPAGINDPTIQPSRMSRTLILRTEKNAPTRAQSPPPPDLPISSQQTYQRPHTALF